MEGEKSIKTNKSKLNQGEVHMIPPDLFFSFSLLLLGDKTYYWIFSTPSVLITGEVSVASLKK
jgi:hypothetical protein